MPGSDQADDHEGRKGTKAKFSEPRCAGTGLGPSRSYDVLVIRREATLAVLLVLTIGGASVGAKAESKAEANFSASKVTSFPSIWFFFPPES